FLEANKLHRHGRPPSKRDFVVEVVAQRSDPVRRCGVGSVIVMTFRLVPADAMRLEAAPTHDIEFDAWLAVTIEPGIGGKGTLDVDTRILAQPFCDFGDIIEGQHTDPLILVAVADTEVETQIFATGL